MAEPEVDFERYREELGLPPPRDRRLRGALELAMRPGAAEYTRPGDYWRRDGQFPNVETRVLHEHLLEQPFADLFPVEGDAVANVRLPSLLKDGRLDAFVIAGAPDKIAWRSEGTEPPASNPTEWNQFVCFVLEYHQERESASEQDDAPNGNMVKAEVEVGLRISGQPGRRAPTLEFYRCDVIYRDAHVLADSGVMVYPGFTAKHIETFIGLMQQLRPTMHLSAPSASATDESVEGQG